MSVSSTAVLIDSSEILPHNKKFLSHWNKGKDSSTLAKLFVLRLLEEMHILGYDLVTSTDLSR